MSDQDVLSKNLSGRLFNYFDSFGYDSAKRYDKIEKLASTLYFRLNLHLFPGEEDKESGQVLLHSAGNLLLFHNVQTDEKTVLRSPAGSIGTKLTYSDDDEFFVFILLFKYFLVYWKKDSVSKNQIHFNISSVHSIQIALDLISHKQITSK